MGELVYTSCIYTEFEVSVPRSTRVFRSGNSKAVRLPANYPLELGQEVVVREEAGRYVIEPVDRKIDLTGIAGSMPELMPLMPDDRVIEERALDWALKHVPDSKRA